jgi:hypothetical protein
LHGKKENLGRTTMIGPTPETNWYKLHPFQREDIKPVYNKYD